MTNQLQTFEARVKERLKDSIADLIPEEDMDRLVKASIESFKHQELPKLIKDELMEVYRALIKEELAKPEWTSQWRAESQTNVSQAILKILTDNSGLMFANIVAGIAQGVVYNMQSQSQAYRPY